MRAEPQRSALVRPTWISRSVKAVDMSTLFSELQLETLRAAVDRIVPEDDFPGAWNAGVGEYISRQLNTQLAHLASTYQAGLNGLEAEARHRFGHGFAELNWEQQDSVLVRVESDDVEATWSTPAPVFFSALVSHVAEGYYADPGQGGNRNRVSWRMIGFQGR